MSPTPTDNQQRILESAVDGSVALDEDERDALLTLTRHPSEDVRVEAANALTIVAGTQPSLLGPRADAVLLTLRDADVNVRALALDAAATLATADPESAVEANAISNVAQALNDRNEFVRAQAAESLGEIGEGAADLLLDTGAVQSLARRVDSEDHSDARAQAARALGRIGSAAPELIDERTEGCLERAVDDPEIDRSVRSALDSIAAARAGGPDAPSVSTATAGSTAGFCPQCGTEITTDPEPNFCRSCGHEL
ncbi:HEAT repeat domain-containing protein [Halobellus sp. GM3]|uniref:HEAT repeat domain-containing protein n=1 Tax=Halobellus sp. GM3 TaxID=3458410 RepID=UPI00403D83A2